MRVCLVAQHDVTDHLLLTRRSISNYTFLAGEDHDVEFGNSDTGPDDLADVKRLKFRLPNTTYSSSKSTSRQYSNYAPGILSLIHGC